MNKRNTYCIFTEYNNNKSTRGFWARLANVMNVSVCGDDKRHENETWTQCTDAATKLWRSNKFVSCFVYQCVCSLFITLTRLKLWNLIWKPVRIARAWSKCRRCKEMSEWEENADRHKNQTTQHAHRTSVFIFELLWCFHTPLHRFALRSMWTKKNLWQCKPNYSSFFFLVSLWLHAQKARDVIVSAFLPIVQPNVRIHTQALSYAFAISIALSSASFSIYLGVQFIFAHHLHIIYNIKYIFCVFWSLSPDVNVDSFIFFSVSLSFRFVCMPFWHGYDRLSKIVARLKDGHVSLLYIGNINAVQFPMRVSSCESKHTNVVQCNAIAMNWNVRAQHQQNRKWETNEKKKRTEKEITPLSNNDH